MRVIGVFKVSIEGQTIQKPDFKLISDVVCKSSLIKESRCLYLGMLNLGPILRNKTFIDSFEHKMFKLYSDQNYTNNYVSFGELPTESCYWVKTEL